MWKMVIGVCTNDADKADEWKKNSLDGPVKLLNNPTFLLHLEGRNSSACCALLTSSWSLNLSWKLGRHMHVEVEGGGSHHSFKISDSPDIIQL